MTCTRQNIAIPEMFLGRTANTWMLEQRQVFLNAEMNGVQ